MENTNIPKETDPKFQEYRGFVNNLECTKDKDLKTRLDHVITGIVTEGGELSDLMKKLKFYDAKIPRINFLDELGDLLWYLTAAMNCLEVRLEDLIHVNQIKLRKRYPTGFNVTNAVNKDKVEEQNVIENSTNEIKEEMDGN